jgi:hypothetical protein
MESTSPAPAFDRSILLEHHVRGSRLDTDAAAFEAAVAWRIFRFNWFLIAVAVAVFDLCLLLTDFRIRPAGYLIVLAVAAAYGLVGHSNANSPSRKPAVFSMLTAVAQAMLTISVMISMTYIATAANFPLRDSDLLAVDRALGFDFPAFLNFVDDRTWLIYVFAAGYRAISWPIWLAVVVLPLAGYCRHTGECICALLLALIATTFITAFVPAIGVYGALGLAAADFPNIVPQGYYDTLRDVPLLRDGSLRVLDLFQLAGVVTFPSFHAAAVLYCWMLWPLRWFRFASLFCNGAMLAATPIGGGHFLADVIAGMAIATTAICASRRVGDVSAQRELVRGTNSWHRPGWSRGGATSAFSLPCSPHNAAARGWHGKGCGNTSAAPTPEAVFAPAAPS